METADDVVTKTKFAALCGVSRPCVSQWIRGKKIYGAALIGDGRDKRIRVDIARQQLKQTLDVSQRLGANGKLRFDDDPADVSVEDDIRRARLEQIQLANEQARALRETQAGRYTDTATVRREMGRRGCRVCCRSLRVALANSPLRSPPSRTCRPVTLCMCCAPRFTSSGTGQ